MKLIKTLLVVSCLIAIQANASYGIKPPVTGAPDDGGIQLPKKPGAGLKPAISIGKFEQTQFDVALVLAKTEVKTERLEKYQKDLVALALKDSEVADWLRQLIAYFDSEDYNNQSDSQKEADRFETRLMIEMMIGE